MIRTRNIALKRLLASKINKVAAQRSYHASGKLGADALDMADTFGRRHSEFY
jgi:hypothetical protein